MRETSPPTPGDHHIDLIIRLNEKEKEYRQGLINGKVFSELKKLRDQIRALQNELKTGNFS